MRFTVVTISDRCSKGQMTDTAGPTAVALLRQQWPAAAIDSALLPDGEDAIAALLEQLAADGMAMVLTVGGTGFGPRDRTPEATRHVMDREAPGLAEAMRAVGATKTPFAWLSRGVAGLKGSTLIVNLPGSERAVKQSLTSILPLLKHALEVMAGGQDHP